MLSRRDFLKPLSSAGTGLFFAEYARENPKIKRVHLLERRVAGFQYHDGRKPEVADLLVPPLDLALGRTSAEIAAQLNLSDKTVETYRARGMEKFGIKSRAALARFALKKGLLGGGEMIVVSVARMS